MYMQKRKRFKEKELRGVNKFIVGFGQVGTVYISNLVSLLTFELVDPQVNIET